MPDNTDFTDEHDWRAVQDRVERRRIQNRIAQRLFRRRTRLGSHSQLAGQQKADEEHSYDRNINDPSISNEKVNVSSSIYNRHNSTRQQLPSPESTPSRKSPTQVPISTPSIPLCSPQLIVNEPQFVHPTVGLINNLSSTRLLDDQHNMLNPQRYEWNNNNKVADDFTLDCFRLPQQVNGRMYGLPGDPALAPIDSQRHDTSNGFVAQWRGSTSMGHDVQVPRDSAGMVMDHDQTRASLMHRYPMMTDGNFDASSNNVWRPDISSSVYPTSLTAANNTHILIPQEMATHNGSDSSNTSPAQDFPPGSAKHALLHELFECISDPLDASGFPNFDSLVTAYYCETFADSSPLANEHRLSRNRHLPKVVSDLYTAADTWTAWETRGFHEEILKTAEAMLISEGDSLDVSEVAALLDAQDQQLQHQQTQQQDGVVDSGVGGGISSPEQMAS